MAITIDSNTETKEEMMDAVKSFGQTPKDNDEPQSEETKPAVEVKTSGEPGAPGEKIPAETDTKTAATTEVVETKPTQETPQGTDKPVEEKPKSKGGFQVKNEKLARQLGETKEALDEERGDKSRLRAKVEELQAEIAQLKPAGEKKDEGPVRPKRPKREDVDFDDAKYESLLDKYEEQMDDYHASVADRKASEQIAAADERRRQEALQANQDRLRNAHFARVAKDAEELEDWEEVFEPLVEAVPITDAIEAALYESEHPGYILHYFASNLAEVDRLKTMTPAAQIRELTKIEDRLVRERQAAKATPVTDKPVVAKAPETETPAKPATKKVETPDEPLTTVGSRAGTKNDTPEAAFARGDIKTGTRLIREAREARGAA